jgi:hypothetical protein
LKRLSSSNQSKSKIINWVLCHRFNVYDVN